jgi:hypothetical protein
VSLGLASWSAQKQVLDVMFKELVGRSSLRRKLWRRQHWLSVVALFGCRVVRPEQTDSLSNKLAWDLGDNRKSAKPREHLPSIDVHGIQCLC